MRAVAQLRGAVGESRRRPRRVRTAEADAGTDGWLLALEYVGAISPGEAVDWRRRRRDAEAEAERVPVPFAPEVLERAGAPLDSLLVAVKPGAQAAFRSFFSAVAAYLETGVLSADEALTWRERLRAQMGIEPERPTSAPSRGRPSAPRAPGR